jgi:hypothetical protein
MGAAPWPVFGAGTETGVDRIHERVPATAMEVLVVTDEMFVRFVLPEGDDFL